MRRASGRIARRRCFEKNCSMNRGREHARTNASGKPAHQIGLSFRQHIPASVSAELLHDTVAHRSRLWKLSRNSLHFLFRGKRLQPSRALTLQPGFIPARAQTLSITVLT
jgi:hypothetical protein